MVDNCDDRTEVWQYKLHEEGVFYQRLNFFLVAESMLLVAFGAFFTAKNISSLVLLTLGGLGLFLTLAWMYVSARQLLVIKHVSTEAKTLVPIYK